MQLNMLYLQISISNDPITFTFNYQPSVTATTPLAPKRGTVEPNSYSPMCHLNYETEAHRYSN